MEELSVLCATAASIAFLHTLLGPDHYLPFVAMSRAGTWSLRKTIWVTLLCGVGHVLSSVLLGMIGLGFGVAVFKLETVEAMRGSLAGFSLIAFGLLYTLWGLRRAIRNQPHTHRHGHADGTVHAHAHVHSHDHLHGHERPAREVNPGDEKTSLTPWILFTIFLFGPCEPLIPLVMYPAARGSSWGVMVVTIVFSVVTLVTMTTVVVLSRVGAGALGMGKLQRYSHATAGLVILACGVAVQTGW